MSCGGTTARILDGAHVRAITLLLLSILVIPSGAMEEKPTPTIPLRVLRLYKRSKNDDIYSLAKKLKLQMSE